MTDETTETADGPCMPCPRGMHACERDGDWYVCLPCGIRWWVGPTTP